MTATQFASLNNSKVNEVLSNSSPTGDSSLQEHSQTLIHDANAYKPNQNVPEKSFSIYTKREKWFMVAMVALAGMFRYALKSNLVAASY